MSAASQLNKMSTMLFNKSLSTMVKGIRNHKDRGEQEYIMKCIGEIKEELKSSYPEIKAGAIQKLIYLQMLGYDMSWASFNIVEVMSAPWFGHKRVGYLAAALTFTKDTDVILLTTHLFRKGFTQVNTANMTADGLQYETGAAISCLACICTPDLGMDLLSDIYGMMNSSRPYIRKKAVLVLLKIFRAWPQALRLSFDRLKDKLNDENQGVVSAAVYVICELAAKNPTNYLRLAPQFYKILTSSSNNWVLIKVVKLLGSLVPEEPRLAKKLMEPLSDIINTTPAKSLLYECVNTLLSGRLTSKTIIRLCLDKLRTFIEDPDQNLKYLGLLGLHKLMKKHPRVVAEHKDLILDCLKDDDVTIRMRALDLITSMVSKKNLVGIVRRLIDHLDVSDGAYREHVLERIIFICSQENFAYISNFEWYIGILVDLTHLHGASRENALRIANQLMDVVIRVPAVRRYGVRTMTQLLITERLLQNSTSNAMSEVLFAAAFLVGEFAEYVEEHLDLVTVMLKPQVATLSQSVQNIFIQGFIKVLCAALMQPFDVADKDLEAVFDPEEKRSREKLEKLAHDDEQDDALGGGSDEIEETVEKKPENKQEDDDEDDASLLKQEEDTGLRKLRVKAQKRTYEQWRTFIIQHIDVILSQLPVFTHSNYVEVQERAVCYYAFIQWLQSVFNDPQSILKSSSTTTTTTPATEITVIPTPTPTPAPAPVLDLLSQFDPNASSSPPPASPSPTPAPAPITPSSSSSGPTSRELLRSVANQFAALFSERLNPVNPKAQKKVPVPKGLDLDAQINEEEHDAESESENESDDGYSLEDPDDKAAREREKDKKKNKKRHDSDDDETEYIKPVTKEDREEASKRLAARRQRQENDPFYIKDRPNSSYSGNHSSAAGSTDFQTEGNDVDAIPMKRLEDGDLPPVRMNKLDKKLRRKKNDLDDDYEEEHVTAKTYKITSTEEMPEDAEVSDEESNKKSRRASDDEMNVDLTTPLGQDEIIPRVQAYSTRPVATSSAPVDKSKMSKEERKAAKAAKKEKRREERGENKKDKKKKEKTKDKDKEKEKDKDKEKDAEKDKKKKKKSDDKRDENGTSTHTPTPSTANVLDLFDPMMDAKPTPASPPPAAKSPPSSSPKNEQKQSNTTTTTSAPTAEELLKFRSLYKDSRMTIRYRMQPVSSTTLALYVEFAYGKIEKSSKSSSKSLSSLSLDFTSTAPYSFSTKSITTSTLNKGTPQYHMINVEYGGKQNVPINVPVNVSYAHGSETKKKSLSWTVPVSSLIQPKKITLTELGQILNGKGTNALANKNVTLESIEVPQALKLIGALLNVTLIEAVSFTATYYGTLISDNSHICILVKAKKGDNKNISIEIKSNTQSLSDTLLKECIKELE